MLIYMFGEIKSFNVLAGYNKKKLQAEDLITINFLHKNNIISLLKRPQEQIEITKPQLIFFLIKKDLK